jgi:hypothetical protein
MEVLKGKISRDVPIEGKEINVRMLSSGIYFLNLYTTGWKYQGKFVVD